MPSSPLMEKKRKKEKRKRKRRMKFREGDTAI
jgi:hypothetical protein